jgi:uncharacterized protein YqiB (DUF1249 family)
MQEKLDTSLYFERSSQVMTVCDRNFVKLRRLTDEAVKGVEQVIDKTRKGWEPSQ